VCTRLVCATVVVFILIDCHGGQTFAGSIFVSCFCIGEPRFIGSAIKFIAANHMVSVERANFQQQSLFPRYRAIETRRFRIVSRIITDQA